MKKELTFGVDDIKHIDSSEYDSDDYMLARVKFLSTRPNSHDIVISEDVLRQFANTVLGKWVTAEVFCGDCTTHTDRQKICGIVPKEQDVEFVETDDGYLDAYVDCIISKRYAKAYCDVFSEDDARRSVSIEATFSMVDERECDGFDIKTITTLGRAVHPSVPDANITIVRFSEEDAESYYNNLHKSDSLSNLKQFVEERKQSMEEKKTYKVDKSKESMSTADWGDVDKTALRNKIMDAENRAELVKDVYLLVEDGWEDAPSEHLKYPIMQFNGDTLVYNRNALSAALAYAKQNDEAEVVNKIKDIYEKLDIDDESERKEEAAMEMEEVKNLADTKVEAESVLEEEEETEVKAEEVCDNPDCDEHDDHDDDCNEHDEEMSIDELKGRIAQLEKDVEDKNNIIMGKDAELAELRQFKQDVEDKEKAISVESIMAECKEFMSDEAYKQMREEGMACEFAAVDAWANKVKAYCFTAVKKAPKKEKSDVFSFAAPVEKKEHKGLWD